MPSAAYEAAENPLIFSGVSMFGFAEGDLYTITQLSENVTLTEGADGHTIFNFRARNAFAVDLNLLYTSQANAVMSTIKALGRAGMGPLLAKNNLGADFFAAPFAAIEKMPDFKVAEQVGTVPWRILCGSGTMFIGGTASL